MDHILDCYQGDGNFTLNNIEINMGLKDISGLRVVTLTFQPSTSDDETTFKERFFLGVKLVSYQEISNPSFGVGSLRE